MPFGIRKDHNKWVVYNRETGRVFGHHSTRDSALSQLAVLHMRTRNEHRSGHGKGYARAHIHRDENKRR